MNASSLAQRQAHRRHRIYARLYPWHVLLALVTAGYMLTVGADWFSYLPLAIGTGGSLLYLAKTMSREGLLAHPKLLITEKRRRQHHVLAKAFDFSALTILLISGIGSLLPFETAVYLTFFVWLVPSAMGLILQLIQGVPDEYDFGLPTTRNGIIKLLMVSFIAIFCITAVGNTFVLRDSWVWRGHWMIAILWESFFESFIFFVPWSLLMWAYGYGVLKQAKKKQHLKPAEWEMQEHREL